MSKKLRTALYAIKAFFNVLFMAISPLALLMLIVAFIMFLDYYGAYRRLRKSLDETVLTSNATITSCYEEDRYCFADYVDAEGFVRFAKLDWRYYPKNIQTELTALARGDTVEVRYAQQDFDNEIILAKYYDAFVNYKGYLRDTGTIALVSWAILIFHPEVMLFSLVDNLNHILDDKWKRMTKPR